MIGMALAGVSAAANGPASLQSSSLQSASDRTAFRRWFTFLAESRYYARKKAPQLLDGDALIRWAIQQSLKPHDLAWSRHVELPVFPVMPSIEATIGPQESRTPVLVSRDLADAQPGDLLLYANESLPARVMVYIGRSQIVPSPEKWVVYVTERVHWVSVELLRTDPAVEWRPVPENPAFRGVWRLDILSAAE